MSTYMELRLCLLDCILSKRLRNVSKSTAEKERQVVYPLDVP